MAKRVEHLGEPVARVWSVSVVLCLLLAHPCVPGETSQQGFSVDLKRRLTGDGEVSARGGRRAGARLRAA